MFDQILESRKLTTLTALVLSLLPRSLGVFEVSRKTGLGLGAAGRLLSRLAGLQLLKLVTMRGKKYYFLNPHLEIPPIFRIKILKACRREFTDDLSKDIKGLKSKAAFLSGVFSGYQNLPVDVLLVGRVDLKKFNRFLEKWQGIMGLELNYSLMSEKEFLSRRDTFDKFIKDIFDHRHVVVVDRLGKK